MSSRQEEAFDYESVRHNYGLDLGLSNGVLVLLTVCLPANNDHLRIRVPLQKGLCRFVSPIHRSFCT